MDTTETKVTIEDVLKAENENVDFSDLKSSVDDNDSEKTIKRLEKAWFAILSSSSGDSNSLLNKSKQTSIQEGEGMSIFRFLRPSKGEHSGERPNECHDVRPCEHHNCEFFYAEKDSFPWNTFIESLGDIVKEDFLQVYQSSKHFVICVSIPEHEIGDITIQQIKIFGYADNKEVNF